MKRRLLILCLCVVSHLSAEEFRTAIEYRYKLDRKQSIDFSSELRAKYEGEINNYLFFKVDYAYKLSAALKVKTTQRYSFECKEGGNNKYRSTLDLVYKFPRRFGDTKVKNRLRFQYELSDFEKHQYILRDQVEFTFDINKYTTPFLAFEMLYDVQNEIITESRISLGSYFEIDDFKFGVYYKMALSEGYKTVNFDHVIGLAFLF